MCGCKRKSERETQREGERGRSERQRGKEKWGINPHHPKISSVQLEMGRVVVLPSSGLTSAAPLQLAPELLPFCVTLLL